MLSQGLVKEVTALFQAKQRQLYVAALAITRERGSAEDAVQDALLAVASLRRRPDKLEAYLFRTVRNKALHSVKRDRRFDTGVDLIEFLDVAHCSEEQKILATQVTQQLSELDEDPRQVIIMKLFADLTFNEIAAITANSPNTVASWYRRGIEQLRETLSELHAQ